jgi:DNA-binding GntR family transcriptional regulator
MARGRETGPADADADGHEVVPSERLGLTIAETLASRLQELVTELAAGFEPGQRLDVEGIAERFGVSATPVKQALKRLEARGLVEIRPRRGHFVTQLSDLDVREIMATRSALEQAGIRACRDKGLDRNLIERLRKVLGNGRRAVRDGKVETYRASDVEFHRIWVEASGNRRLMELYDFLLAQAKIVYVYVPHSPEDIATSLSEHEDLLRIAERGELGELEAALDQHWKNSADRALKRYQSYILKRADAKQSRSVERLGRRA